MDYCETEFQEGKDRTQCFTHGGDATHVSPDGDSVVCQKYADLLGCKCCSQNFEKLSRVDLSVGDEIVVNGRVFVLVSCEVSNAEPARVYFSEFRPEPYEPDMR